jgi:hypothetical protein
MHMDIAHGWRALATTTSQSASTELLATHLKKDGIAAVRTVAVPNARLIIPECAMNGRAVNAMSIVVLRIARITVATARVRRRR